MITMDYIVQPKKQCRRWFYNLLIRNKFEPLHFKKNDFVNMPYPFIINNNVKVFSMLNSITCCAMASVNNKIISTDEYIEISQK